MKVIRMATFEPECLTTEEFARLQREVIADVIADPGKIGTRILARLVEEHLYRYHEIRAAERGD